MDRSELYRLLLPHLEQARAKPYAEIVAAIGTVERHEVPYHLGEVFVEVVTEWRDQTSGTILITASAFGPSCFNLQRLDEFAVVEAPRSD